mmetsp:Transcript_2750/g.8857  ORF Transcript_2750/g.8857 Transcript_2750/m.8857 type:complete len:229 (+) Transcript_2750:2890-3576(+)
MRILFGNCATKIACMLLSKLLVSSDFLSFHFARKNARATSLATLKLFKLEFSRRFAKASVVTLTFTVCISPSSAEESICSIKSSNDDGHALSARCKISILEEENSIAYSIHKHTTYGFFSSARSYSDWTDSFKPLFFSLLCKVFSIAMYERYARKFAFGSDFCVVIFLLAVSSILSSNAFLKSLRLRPTSYAFVYELSSSLFSTPAIIFSFNSSNFSKGVSSARVDTI